MGFRHPQAQIVAIADLPALKWRRSSGWHVCTPPTMF
jgi:hypothetical protein